MLKHLLASKPQPLRFAADSKIHAEKNAAAKFDAGADTGRWMQVLQTDIFRTREDPAGVDERYSVEKCVQRPAVLGIHDESVAIAKAVLVETAHCVRTACGRQQEKWKVGRRER